MQTLLFLNFQSFKELILYQSLLAFFDTHFAKRERKGNYFLFITKYILTFFYLFFLNYLTPLVTSIKW